MEMELHCILPTSEVNALAAGVAPIAKMTTVGSSVQSPWDAESNGKLFPPWFNIHDIPNRPELSDAYTVYVIGVGHGDKTDAHESHWSYEYGIAVNLQKSEVIYWINARAD